MDKLTPKSNARMSRPVAAPKPQGILVLGMHRSGTSACTRMLNMLGCALSGNLLGSGDGNESGHWEAIEAIALNDEILASAGSSHDDWGPINADWRRSSIHTRMIGQAREIVADHLNAGPLFAIKDPRICRLADVWIQAAHDAGAEPLVLLMVRNPVEVAASLEARDMMATGYAELLWLRHVLDAEFFSRGQTRVVCHYDELMGNWRNLVSKITDGLGVSFPRNSRKIQAEIDGFLTENLRHHRAGPDDLIRNPAYSEWLRTTYAVMLNWSTQGESASDYPVLDEVRAQLDRAYEVFARLLVSPELVGAAGSAGQLRRELASLQEQAAGSAQALQDARHLVDELRAGTEQREAEHAAQIQAEVDRAQALQAEIARRDAELAEQESALAGVQASLEAAQARADDELRRREDAEGQLSHTSAALQEQMLRMAELTGQISALQSALSQRQEELAQVYDRLNDLAQAKVLAEAGQEHERQQRIELEKRADAAEARADAERRHLQSRLEETKQSAAQRAEMLTGDLAKVTRLLSEQEEAGAQLRAELEEQRTQARALHEKVEHLGKTAELAEAARRENETRLSARFNELAQLTAIAAQESEQASRLQSDREWLRDIRRVEEGFPAWWSLMPQAWQRSRRHRRYRRSGLFDPQAYLDLYPDVAEQGMDPLRHYVLHGMAEGRARTTPA